MVRIARKKTTKLIILVPSWLRIFCLLLGIIGCAGFMLMLAFPFALMSLVGGISAIFLILGFFAIELMEAEE